MEEDNLKKLFEEAGISAEDFKKYFLDPLYPEQNASVINGIVYTEEDDGAGGVELVEQGLAEEIIRDNPEIFLAMLRDKKLDEKVFISWLAQQKNIVNEKSKNRHNIKKPERDISRQQDTGVLQKKSTEKAETPRQNKPEEAANTETRSIAKTIAAGFREVSRAARSGFNMLFPRRRRNENSNVGEVRSLAEEQYRQSRMQNQRAAKETTKNKEKQIKQQTKDLAKELEKIDALSDKNRALDEEKLNDSLKKALSDVGKINLGLGADDAKKVERSKTPNDKERDKAKEI